MNKPAFYAFGFFVLFFSSFAFSVNSYAAPHWVYFSSLSPCATSFLAYESGGVAFSSSSVGFGWGVPQTLSGDSLVSCSGAVVVQSLLSVYSPLPPAPIGYFTQADLDAAVAAAGGSAITPANQLTFAQGTEISMAVVAACMIAVSFGLMRKASA